MWSCDPIGRTTLSSAHFWLAGQSASVIDQYKYKYLWQFGATLPKWLLEWSLQFIREVAHDHMIIKYVLNSG